jgi:tRNA-Thr(GGU) m(6)t(6)A37 methyltransferase TsaA
MIGRIRRVFQRRPDALPDFQDVTLRPIGYVRSRVKKPMADGWADVESRIVLRPELGPALLGIDGYSHIIVVFWPDRVSGEVRGSRLQHHPRDDPKYPLMGILATRSQVRPNPVLVTPVALLGVKNNVLKVRGLDAIDGTPVLDVKPYLPFYDAIAGATTPDWVRQSRGR